jgi:hypothetical protein
MIPFFFSFLSSIFFVSFHGSEIFKKYWRRRRGDARLWRAPDGVNSKHKQKSTNKVSVTIRCRQEFPGQSKGETWRWASSSCLSEWNQIQVIQHFQLGAIDDMKRPIFQFFTSPTEVAKRPTMRSWGTATTLWPLISIIRWPTRTPPRSAIPPLRRLQICRKKKVQTRRLVKLRKC